MIKKLTIQVVKRYVVEIDEDAEIVKEYDSEQELIHEIASYNFSSALPVIGKGVYVIDSDLTECEVVSRSKTE